MNDTLKNLLLRIDTDMQRTANHFQDTKLGLAILRGYLDGSAVPAQQPQEENRSTLFIDYQNFKEIKRMLINLNIKGSVRERPDGLLELRVWIDGKRTSIYGRTEAELLQKFKIVRKNKKNQTAVQTYTLYVWLDKWIELYKRDSVQPNTLSAITSCIKVHIKPNFSDKPLHSLKPLEIKENLKRISSSRMRKYSYQILNEAYRRAAALKLVKENPFALVDVPQHIQQKGIPLTRQEQEEFKAALIGSPFRHYFLFLLYSGCRRSEGLAARWEDIDFENKSIFIRGTKTKLSRNTIPLFNELEKLLNEIKPTELHGNIFQFAAHRVEMAFKKLCPAHKIHDLRHTFATNCLEAGVELKAVQAWLRHSNISMTADTYAHATDKFLKQEADKLNKK